MAALRRRLIDSREASPGELEPQPSQFASDSIVPDGDDGAVVQGQGQLDGPDIHAVAEAGLSGGGSRLPHHEAIQRAFGHHDVSEVRAHIGDTAADAAEAMGARAYASGDEVAFAAEPDLHLAAHETAHVVQQRAGVRLSGGVGQAGDEYERGADQVADLVVNGKSAEAVLDEMAHRGSAGGPAVQRDETYMTTERYIARHSDRLGPATATALGGLEASLSNGIVAMYASLSNGVGPALTLLRDAIDNESAEQTLRQLCAPTPLESLVDRGRQTTRTSEDLVTTGSDAWSNNVGTDIADAIARNLRASIQRIAGRYAAAKSAAQNAAWQAAGECNPNIQPEPSIADIASSHIVDRYVIRAACESHLFQVDLSAWRSFHPEQAESASVAGVRRVVTGIEEESAPVARTSDPGRFYIWVRSTTEDATAEEVARSFFGDTEYAHLLEIKAPPRYAFNASQVWNLPATLQDRIVGMSPGLQQERERRANRDTGEPQFIGFMVPRYYAEDPEGTSTGEQDPSASLPPEMADEVALAGATSAAPLPEGAAADRSSVLSRMGQNKVLLDQVHSLAYRFEETGMVWGEESTRVTTQSLTERIDERRDRLRTADDATVMRWDLHSRAQQEVLGGALAGLQQAWHQADQNMAPTGQTDPLWGDLNVGRSVRMPLQRVAMAFFGAAARSDIPDSGRAKLAEANQASQLYPVEMMELVLQEVESTLAGVRSESTYDVESKQLQEKILRVDLARLRQLILARSPDAGQVMESVFAQINDLQNESVMIADMDGIDRTWSALGDMADSFGVWGDADERLRVLQREARDWKSRWNAIYQDWQGVTTTCGPDIEQQKLAIKARFDTLREDPDFADFLGRVRAEMSDAGDRALVAKLIALLVITVATMGAGAAVSGFVGAAGLGWGAAATTAAVVVTEAAVFTTLHTAAFVQNPTLAGIAGEFGYNVLLFGALRGVSAALRVGRLGTFLSESGNLAKVELMSQGVVMGSMTVARAEIENRMSGGTGISAEEAAIITAESTAMFVAIVVLGRAAQPLLTRIEGASGQLGAKIRIANQERAAIAELARTVQDTRDLELARELMLRDRESLIRDREALQELMTTARNEPQILRDQGMTTAEIEALAAELGPGVQRMQVAEIMQGVENIGGDTYTAGREEMAGLLGRHQQAGANIREGGVDRITSRRWFEVEYNEGLKFRIFEGSAEAQRPGMAGQEPPSAAQAAELRAAAEQARVRLAERDDQLTRLVMNSAEPVIADTVIIGSGQAGTLAHAALPSGGRAVPGVEITEVPRTFNVAEGGSTFAQHGDFQLGQGHGELASPSMTRQPGEFSTGHSGRASAADHVNALTMTALDTGMATVRARVEMVEVNPRDGSWPVEKPLRITLTGGKVVYATTVVGAMGLGPPRPAGLVGEEAVRAAGKLVYAQESLTLPGGGRRILVIGGGPSGMWAAEAAINAGAQRVLWSGRSSAGADVPADTRATLEGLGLTSEQISAFHTAYNSRNRAGFDHIGERIELTTATLERASVTADGQVRITSGSNVIEVDGVVVAVGQRAGLPPGMDAMRFRLVTMQYHGAERLIALDAVDATGAPLGIRLTGAQIMNRGMASYIEGGPGEVQRYHDLVSAIANDPSTPSDSLGVPGSIYQSNINVPEAVSTLPGGGTYRPGQAGHPPNDDDHGAY